MNKNILIVSLLLFCCAINPAKAAVPDGPHPRIWLDSARLSLFNSLQASEDPKWVALEAWCDDHLGDTGYDVAGDINTTPGPINWKGYRGSGYLKYLLSYALGYQVLKDDNPSKAARYAAYAIQIMDAMIVTHSVGEGLDGLLLVRAGDGIANRTLNSTEASIRGLTTSVYKLGYSARNYGIALPVAYDWLYDQLSEVQKSKFQAVMYRCVDWYRGERTQYNDGILIGGVRYHEDKDGDCAGINNCDGLTGRTASQMAGYGADAVTNNFFSGFFSMAVLVPIATYGDNSYAGDLLTYLQTVLLPFTKDALTNPLLFSGGDSPEGWNYGSGWFRDIEAMEAYVDSTGENIFTDFDWPAEMATTYMQATNSGLTKMLLYGEWTGDYEGVPYEYHLQSSPLILNKYYSSALAGSVVHYLLTAQHAIKDEIWHELLWANTVSEADIAESQSLSWRAAGNGLVTMRTSWTDTTNTLLAGIRLEGRGGLAHESYDEGDIQIIRGNDRLLSRSKASTASVYYSTIVFNNLSHHASNPPLSSTAIDKFIDKNDFVYVRGDITNAWKRAFKPDLAELFVRKMVYVRPGFFIIHDATQSNPTQGLIKSWYTQHSGDPVINENIISSTTGSSKIFVKSLLPANGIFTKDNPSTGHWRVKYEPVTPQEYEQFLHVMEATASDTAQMVETQLVRSIDGAMVGAYVKDTAKPTVVMFSADKDGKNLIGTLGQTVSYSLQSTDQNLRHILVDLPASTVVTILPVQEDGNGATIFSFKFGSFPNEGETTMTSEQGILRLPEIPVIKRIFVN